MELAVALLEDLFDVLVVQELVTNGCHVRIETRQQEFDTRVVHWLAHTLAHTFPKVALSDIETWVVELPVFVVLGILLESLVNFLLR